MTPTAEADLERQNRSLLDILCAARPRLTGLKPALQAVPGMAENRILHAGPPIAWAQMTPAMQAAVAGALVHEGLAGTLEGAAALAGSGEIDFAPAHDHQAAGAMAGIVSASMPVFVAEDAVSGLKAFATVNEGLGKTLRFGANGPEVLARLAWIRDDLAPLLDAALAAHEPLDLGGLVAEALRRGDECHNRNKAATALVFRELALSLVDCDAPRSAVAEALRFVAGNDHFFLNLSMAHAKAVTLALEREAKGSLVTTMAGNGREVGIRTSATGARWFTAPAEVADVRLFAGQSLEDATPTMGDSYVTEAIGLGGFALAAAPAIAEFVGGTVADLVARSERMREIAVGEHSRFLIPSLGFRGVPSGIDVHRVARSGIAPIVNTGVASKRPGAGQIGAGVQSFPLAVFQAAARALEAA
ncbi:MAG: DUF1116 domain-containing protein [Rhodovibrionaceae bacterium]